MALQEQRNFQIARKTARVTAEYVAAGTRLRTIMKDGHVETENLAPVGGAMKVTNPSGEAYLVDLGTFAERYVQTDDGDYAPVSAPILVRILQEDISFTAPWGEKMHIKAGGALVETACGGPYGIQPAEFTETYTILEDWPEAKRENPHSE